MPEKKSSNVDIKQHIGYRTMMSDSDISVILPVKNEEASLGDVLGRIRSLLPECEIVVVNDGSTDSSGDIANQHADVVITHPISMGNGAAIKSGARNASRDILVFMDADGQHDPNDIPKLLEKLSSGYSMVVGARLPSTQASIFRRIANAIYNKLASYITGHRISDLTSGFRVCHAEKFREYIDLLPNGFSYPTTITMAFLRSGYAVEYLPISAGQREGKSHIRLFYDGARFFLIIFRVGTLYSPLKIFAPAALLLFLTASFYYSYTFVTQGRFTNMSALLYTTSMLTFFIGLVSEQVTHLLYSSIKKR